MNNKKAKWILNSSNESIDCASFPYAFRTAYNLVRKAIETKGNVSSVMNGISILGPANTRGERKKYSYSSATQLAMNSNLLTPDGSINSKAFNKK